jgi:hypothetical protein
MKHFIILEGIKESTLFLFAALTGLIFREGKIVFMTCSGESDPTTIFMRVIQTQNKNEKIVNKKGNILKIDMNKFQIVQRRRKQKCKRRKIMRKVER